MCGRFQAVPAATLRTSPFVDKVSPNFSADIPTVFTPGNHIPVIGKPAEERVLTTMHWGIRIGDNLIYNTRDDSLYSKEFWHDYRDNRIVVPIFRFYEGGRWWSRHDLMYAAGIYAPSQMELKLASIVTTNANEAIRPHHKRMPLFLETEESVNEWLEDVA